MVVTEAVVDMVMMQPVVEDIDYLYIGDLIVKLEYSRVCALCLNILP